MLFLTKHTSLEWRPGKQGGVGGLEEVIATFCEFSGSLQNKETSFISCIKWIRKVEMIDFIQVISITHQDSPIVSSVIQFGC